MSARTELAPLPARWAARRPAPSVLHLDSAAASRQSEATLAATAAHARSEAVAGAYVAEAAAQPVIEQGRADLARLLGVPTDGVAFVEGASAALATLLRVWPLPRQACVAVAGAEWGPNTEAFRGHGHRLVDLAVDGTGSVDLAALERHLADDPPDLVHLTHAASHRGLLQPAAEIARLARAAGVPVWVDAAQALGHVDAASGADAVYGTSRKWLAGPRGVGMLAVAQRWWGGLRVPRPAMAPPDLPPVRYLDSHDAHVAGRVGLANAVRELVGDGPDAVHARLAGLGRRAREVLDSVPGWRVDDGCSAIVALYPAAGQDVPAVRARLLSEFGILTTSCRPARAPRDMTGPLLRLSPHVDADDAAFERLHAALAALG